MKLYEDTAPIFDHFGITRQIKSSFGKTVSFKSGAYIIIEHTEALHVIDVNSGNRPRPPTTKKAKRPRSKPPRRRRNSAPAASARHGRNNRGRLHRHGQGRTPPAAIRPHARDYGERPRAVQYLAPKANSALCRLPGSACARYSTCTVAEECPSCFGKGKVQPSILFTDTLFEKLEYMVGTLGLRDFVMYVHPYVDAYIKKGLFSTMYGKWRRTLGRCFKIVPDQSLAYLQYQPWTKTARTYCCATKKTPARAL